MRKLIFYILLFYSFVSYSQSSCVDVLTISVQNADCNSPSSYSGSGTITVLNGSGNYSYEWQDANGTALFPPQTAATANNLPPGDYIVEVTDVVNNCVEIEQVSIGYVGLIDAALTFTSFSDNPVYYNQWTFDTVKIYNYGCETRVRPEFRISHPSAYVTTSDFIIDYYDPLTTQWLPIFTMNDNGEVIGYYGDTIGSVVNQPVVSQTIRVKYLPSADIGVYTSENELWEVDINGVRLEKLDSLEFVSLELQNACPTFTSTANVTNASCFGFNDGEIDLEVTGGSPPYTYQWSTSAQSQDLSALQADTYSVIIQDAGVCLLFDTLVVGQAENGVPNNRYTNNITATSVDLVFTPSMHVDQYRFRYRPSGAASWQFAGIGFMDSSPELDSIKPVFNLLSNTSYEWQMKVWGLNGCVDGWSDSKYFTTLCVDVTLDSIPISCFNNLDAQLGLEISGTGEYSVLWSTQETADTIFNLGEGYYHYLVSDTSGCIVSDTVYLSNPQQLNINLPESIFVCGSDTTLEVASFHSYLWSTGEVTQSILIDTTSLYTVQVTNPNGCSAVDSAQVYVINGYPNVSSVSLCLGDTAVLYAEGSGDYLNYWWPNNTISDSIEISPSSSVNYQLIISQNNHSCYHNIEVEVVDMPMLSLSSLSTSCFGGSDGSAQALVTNGVPPYSYSWSNNSTLSVVNGLEEGYITITLLDSNNCQLIDSVYIEQPQEIDLTTTMTPPSCSGYSDGSLILSISGGVPSFNINWSNGDNTIIADSLSSGLHLVEVIDANNCLKSDTFLLIDPAPLSLSEDISQHEDVLCYGEATASISLEALGGTPLYNYSLDAVNYQSSPTFSSLLQGAYWFFVQDNNNCEDSILVNISQPLLQLSIQEVISSHQDVTCFSNNNGQLEVVGSGGVSPYQYIYAQDTVFFGLIDSLSAGNYSLSVLDANNCVGDIVIQISEPSELVASYLFEEPSCYGFLDGELTAQATGGTPNYTFFWEGLQLDTLQAISAGSYQLVVIDVNSCSDTINTILNEPDELFLSEDLNMHEDASCYSYSDGEVQLLASGGQPSYLFAHFPSSFQIQGSFSGLSAGSHTFILSDVNNCTDTILINITEPDEILLLEDLSQHIDVTCFGANEGQLSVLATGGTPFYVYTIDGQSSQNFGLYYSLLGGVYQLLATDINSCVSDTLEVLINAPSQGVNISEELALHQDVQCFSDSTGSFSVSAFGGTPGYFFSIDQQNWQQQGVFDSLFAGLYTVTVSDSNLCENQTLVQIHEPPLLSTMLESTNATCFNSSDAVVASSVQGGLPPYNYYWSNSSTNDSLLNVLAGIYNLLVVDSNNCQDLSFVQITEPLSLQATTNVTNIDCYNAMNGSVAISVSGGTPSYLISLNGGAFLSSTIFNNLGVGLYNFELMDANNCLDSLEIVVSQPDSLYFDSLSVVDVQCFGESSGSVFAQPLGGVLPYAYSLNSGMPQQLGLFSGLVSQQYVLEVVDSNNCSFIDTLIVRQPDSMIVSSSEIEASCFGINDGELLVNVVSGGTPPYGYSIENNLFYQLGSFIGLPAGIDTLVIQDSLNCQQSYIFEITEPDSLSINVTSQEPSCFGECDGIVQATIFGGNSYSLLWSNFVSGLVNDSLCDGLISLTVTDSMGCSNYYSYDLQQPSPVYPIVTQNGGILQTDSTYFNYQWFDSSGLITGETSFNYSPTLSGMYWVEVIDSSGCMGLSLGYDFLFSSMQELDEGWKVYPNPTKNSLFLESDSDITWIISDTQGKLLMKGVCFVYTEIDVSSLRKGVYIVQILKENHTFFKKIIKQ